MPILLYHPGLRLFPGALYPNSVILSLVANQILNLDQLRLSLVGAVRLCFNLVHQLGDDFVCEQVLWIAEVLRLELGGLGLVVHGDELRFGLGRGVVLDHVLRTHFCVSMGVTLGRR